MNISNLTPEQHAKLSKHVATMTRYIERLLNRLYQRRLRKDNEFVQKTYQAQRAMNESQHYINSNPPNTTESGDLPF